MANVPYIQNGVYTSALIDGKTASTASASIDGWALQVGAYNGATVTWKSLGKIQGNSTMRLTVDGTSSITINGWGGGNLGNSGYALNYYVAAANGVAWNADISNATKDELTMNYYLAGNGSVSYKKLGKATHVIKQADVTLTGTSQVSSKTLVSFSSTTKTFTAAADINVYGTDGKTLVTTVNLATVNTTGTTTLTADSSVGSCEIVQTTTGIVLYYVDGAPSAVMGYKPSININFTHNGGNLTTTADVGLAPYAVPGTVWNNYAVPADGAISTQTSVYSVDATGVKSLVSGATVSISGTRGSHTCNTLTAASDLRHGYIDEKETAGQNTPTVVVSGISYERYRVVIYAATDTANVTFNYITINGTDYTYVNSKLATGATAWGDTGAANSANALAEGVNVLVSPVLRGSTATISGHKGSPARGCIAAVQIVEYTPEIGENDLVIELDGDKTHTFEEAKTYDTVYVTGSGTLTFAGTASTATTLDISGSAAVNMNGSTLTPSAVTGNGTAIYDGAQPSTNLGFDNSANWTGTVWIKNYGTGGDTTKVGVIGTDSGTASSNVMNNWGNVNSSVKFTNVRGWCDTGTLAWTLVLEDDGTNYAWYNNNGYSGRKTTFGALKGTGTFYDVGNTECRQLITFSDASGFAGVLHVKGKRIGLGGDNTAANNSDGSGTIEIASGATATVSAGKTWSVANKIVVNGTLNVNGTLASDSATAAVSGSGTVVFTGKLPSVNGSAWWQNTGWEGTLWIKSVAIAALDSNLYGNERSTLKFTSVTGYFAQNHVNTVPIELENSGSTAAFNYNNGWGGELLTFNELKGNGTLQTSSAGDGGTIWVKKWDAFTGVMNLGKKQVVMGGSEPAHDNVNRNGKLVIAEGAVVTNLNATTSWTAGADIEVNGTFAASDRSAWADGTAMTVNSTGILNMYGSGVNDTSKSFANVTGTGTIWYSQTTTANDKWSALPSSAANMFANTLSVSNDNVNAGVIITMNGASDVVTTNANISGTGYFRSDWDSGAYRGFLALQSKNTTWRGTFGSSSRIKKFIVAGVDGATDRTLTLAGTQSSTIPLTVESLGSVNITGTYLGDTTVSGTFGGTGTLTGNLAFSAGSTFKAFASDADGLSVSGTVTYPTEGTVTVDVSALEKTGTKVLMTASGLDVSKFALAGGQSGKLSVADGALKVSFTTYVAEYNDVPYETVQAAIDAAEQAGQTYADVTILDPNATCPDGYYVDTEKSNALAKCQAAIVQDNAGVISTNYFKTAQLAVDEIEAHFMTYVYYSHFEVYSGTAVAISVNPSAMMWSAGASVKVKCLNGATVAVAIDSTEYELTAGTADADGIVTYAKTEKATTYVWAGAISDSATTSEKNYARAGNWKVGTSSGATAARAPGSLDTVVFGNGAYASTTASQIVAALQVNGAVTIIGGGTLTSASAITLGANDSIVITGTLSPVPTTEVADSYVKTTTSGSTTTYTVATQPTVSDVSFDYGDDFATATVTATVSDAAPSYKLTVGGTEYIGAASGSKVTFSNVATGRTAAYDDVGYEIAATSGSTAVPLAGETSGSAIVADSTLWIAENATNTGKAAAGGEWATAVTYTEGAASVADNTFTPANPSTGDRVVLSFEDVVYPALSDLDGADLAGAQGAIAIGEVSGQTATTNFYVLVNEGGSAVWRATPVQAELDVPYDLELVFDYAKQKYSAKAGGTALSVGGDSGFALCTAGTKVSSLDFKGSGRLASINGSQQTGYMVKDSKGSYYATIAAAISAYASDKSIAPFEMLHAGAAPSGWKIVVENGIKFLVKAAKGFLMMAM